MGRTLYALIGTLTSNPPRYETSAAATTTTPSFKTSATTTTTLQLVNYHKGSMP